MRPSLLGLLLLSVAPLVAEAQRADDDKAQFQAWVEYYKKVAADYEIHLESQSDMPLQMTTEPVMTYSIPEDRVHGAFFVWTQRGRPELIGAIWSGDPRGSGYRTVLHEFHSLSLGRLGPVTINGRRWQPARGIEFQPIPAAPAPTDSKRLRLAQMRTLARQFTGYSTPHGKELTLRTQSQPLFRYEGDHPDVIDAAIFAMFAGWDPDIMLLIEARNVDDKPQWHYAIGRFNAVPMRVEYNGADVWEQKLVEMSDPTSTFYATVVETRHVSDIPPSRAD